MKFIIFKPIKINENCAEIDLKSVEKRSFFRLNFQVAKANIEASIEALNWKDKKIFLVVEIEIEIENFSFTSRAFSQIYKSISQSISLALPQFVGPFGQCFFKFSNSPRKVIFSAI